MMRATARGTRPISPSYAWFSNAGIAPGFNRPNYYLSCSLYALLDGAAHEATYHKTYASEEALLKALSRACVRYGRRLAGL
jgi:hypothetical protein